MNSCILITVTWHILFYFGTFTLFLFDPCGGSRQENNDSTVVDLPVIRVGSSVTGVSEEKRLVKHLLRDYRKVGRMGRPVRNSSSSLVVEFGLGLIKMDVMEKDNKLTMSAWSRYKWTDEYMRWDPEQYGGVKSVKLPTREIWMPDIMLYNTASTEKFEREVLAVVQSDGVVSWYPHRIFHSACSIDVKKFPFDNQTCHIWFGSWTHPIEEVDLELAFPQGIDLSTFQADFKETSKWDILRCDAIKIGDEQPGGFAVLAFTLHLKRRMIFSGYILTFPVVFLSFLTLLVFWLPAESADKSSLGMTIFGSLLLLLLILVEAAPPTAAAVPLLGLYYCFNIVIVMLSIFLSTIVAKLGDQKGSRKPAPKWLKVVIIDGIATLMCLKKPTHMRKKKSEERGEGDESVSLEDTKDTQSNNGLAPDVNTTFRDEMCQAIYTLQAICDHKGSSFQHSNQQMRRVVKSMQAYLIDKCDDEMKAAHTKVTNEEWKFIALVLDKIFLILYIIIIIVSIVFLFPR